MANIGSLVADLELNSASFTRNLKRAESQTKSFASRSNRSLAKAEKAWKGFARSVSDFRRRFLNLNSAIGTLAGSAGLGYLVKRSIDATAEIERQAKMAGVSIEAFQELSYAAQQYQITQDALTDGLKELSLRTDEYVKTEAGPAKEALERLGYTQEALNKKLKDTPALLQDMISRMEGLDKAAQIRIADEIFGGQGGEQFVAMIRGGANAVGGLREEAHELGIVIDSDLVQKSVEAKKQIGALSNLLSAQFNVVVAELAPDIGQAAGNMTEWVTANKDFISQDIPAAMRSFGEGIATVAAALGRAAENARKAYIFTNALFNPGAAGGEIMDMLKGESEGVSSMQKAMEEWDLQGNLAKLGEEAKVTNDSLAQIAKTAQEIEQIEPMGLIKKGAAKPEDIGRVINPDQLRDAQRIIEDTRTPLENMRSESEKLLNLWDDGLISEDTFQRALSQVEEDYMSTMDSMGDKGESTFDQMANAFDGWANRYSSQLNDMLWESELTFDGILESFGKMITEMLIQSAMSDITGALFGGSGGGGGGDEAGWLKTGFNAIMTAWGSGGGASAKGNVLSGGHYLTEYARGGLVNRPTVFPMANGAGLMGEAGPEAILPLTRTPGGDLGVKTEGNGGQPVQNNNFNITVTAPDGNLSKQSQRQLRRQLTRSVGAANRSM